MQASDGSALVKNGHVVRGKGVALEKELPVIEYDLVPLSLLVQRVTGQTYTDLVNLAEILPSTPDAARKRKIVEFVLQARRQLIKLLVIVRWSKDSDSLRKCMNIIGFLGRQNIEFSQAVDHIVDVKSMLAQARQRNYDLVTAVSVLTTGDYNGLPTSLSDPYKEVAKLSDDDVRADLRDMNHAIKWRLACIETVPRAMRRYLIDDGRATFRIEGMWEAVLTYGGDADDDQTQWYLLDLTFLFQVKDARGIYHSTPVGPMKEHIIELCNQEMAPDNTAPLAKAYRFLQRLALNYKLESLYSQAARIEKAWNNLIKVDFRDRKLQVEYWVSTAASAKASGSAEEEEELLVDWLSEATTPAVDLALNERLDFESLLARVTSSHARWSVEQLYGSLKQDLPSDIPVALVDRPDGSTRIQVKLFSTNVVFIHVNTRTGKTEIEPADPTSVVKEARLKSAADKIDKDRKTSADILARLRLSSVQDELESRLALLGLESTRRLALRSADLSRFGSNTVSRLFTFVKLKHHEGYYLVILLLEEGAKVALMSTRVEADGLTSWLTIVEIGWVDLRYSIADREAWRAKSVEPEPVDPDISVETLRSVYAYCQLRISYYRIELALMSRRMSFRTVAFRRRKSRNQRQSIEHPPYLVIRSTDFLRSPPPPLPVPSQPSDGLSSVVLEQKPVSHPNVAVECFVNDDRIRTCVFVKFYDLDLVRFDKASLPACVRVAGADAGIDDGTVVTFVFDKEGDSLDQVVPTFLSAYAVFAKAIVEARYRRYKSTSRE